MKNRIFIWYLDIIPYVYFIEAAVLVAVPCRSVGGRTTDQLLLTMRSVSKIFENWQKCQQWVAVVTSANGWTRRHIRRCKKTCGTEIFGWISQIWLLNKLWEFLWNWGPQSSIFRDVDRNVNGTEQPSHRHDPAPDVSAHPRLTNVKDTEDIVARADRPTHRLYRSDAEILWLDLFGEPAAPVYWQIWLPNYAGPGFRPAMAIVESTFNMAAGTVSGQRRHRSVWGLKTPPSTPEVLQRLEDCQGVGGVQKRCLAVGTGTGDAGSQGSSLQTPSQFRWKRKDPGVAVVGHTALTSASLEPRTYRRRRCPRQYQQPARRTDPVPISRSLPCRAGVSADPPRPRCLLCLGH